MALAKDLLSRQRMVMEQVAERVGYSSASTFSTTFAHYVRRPPKARERVWARPEVAHREVIFNFREFLGPVRHPLGCGH